MIIKAIRAKLLHNHYKISKIHGVNIQVFTSAGTPGVQPVVFLKKNRFYNIINYKLLCTLVDGDGGPRLIILTFTFTFILGLSDFKSKM